MDVKYGCFHIGAVEDVQLCLLASQPLNLAIPFLFGVLNWFGVLEHTGIACGASGWGLAFMRFGNEMAQCWNQGLFAQHMAHFMMKR